MSAPITPHVPQSEGTQPAVQNKENPIFPTSLENLEILHFDIPDTTSDVFLAADPNGNQFVLKYHKNADFTKNEYDACRAAKALGVSVPNVTLLDGSFGGKNGTFLVVEYIEDAKIIQDVMTGDPNKDGALFDLVEKDFIVFSLLGAWDVFSMCFNNVLFQGEDKHYYVDFGNAFGYTCWGGLKSKEGYLPSLYKDIFPEITEASHWWAEKMPVPEIIHFFNPQTNLETAYFYQNLTTEKIKEQIKNLDLTELEELASSGKFPKESYAIIESRAQWLKDLIDEGFEKFEKKWAEFKEQRQAAIDETNMLCYPNTDQQADFGGAALSRSRRIEPVIAANGGCYPQIGDPDDRPEYVGTIYREFNGEIVWLEKADDGTYHFPTWKPEPPKLGPNGYPVKEQAIWDIVNGGEWKKQGGPHRARVSRDFVSSDVQYQGKDTRYYVVERTGGDPRAGGLEFFSKEQVLKVLGSDIEREVFEAYLRAVDGKTKTPSHSSSEESNSEDFSVTNILDSSSSEKKTQG